jgi:hypothetical protein
MARSRRWQPDSKAHKPSLEANQNEGRESHADQIKIWDLAVSSSFPSQKGVSDFLVHGAQGEQVAQGRCFIYGKSLSLGDVLVLIKHQFHMLTCRVYIYNNYVNTLSTNLVPQF